MHIHNKIDIIDSLIETLVTCTNQEPRTKNQESRIKKRYLNVEEDDGEILKPVVVTKPCLYSITQCFAKHHRLLSLSISSQFYIFIRVCNPLGANSFLLLFLCWARAQGQLLQQTTVSRLVCC